MNNYHLSPHGSQWTLRREGSDRAALAAFTKEEAVAASIDYMRDHPGSLKIHNADGTIEEERTYPRSEDPPTTPG